MGHTLLCVLGLLLMNILLKCGQAQDAVLTIEPNWSTFFTTESVTFICDMRQGKYTDWYYRLKRDSQDFEWTDKNYTTLQSLTEGDRGEYRCFGDQIYSPYFKKESNKVSLTVSAKDVILQTPASTLFEGESVTLRCRHRYRTKETNVSFYKDGSPIEMDTNHQPQITSENTVKVISDGSSYKCKFEDEESESVNLKMETQRPKARLTKDHPAEGSVTLTCSVSPSSSSGWKYFWYRGKNPPKPLNTQDFVLISDNKISVSQQGLYWCRGGRGDPVYHTENSSSVVTYRAVVTLHPNWPEIYRGETIALKCDIEDGGDNEWEYEWNRSNSHKARKQKEYMIRNALSSDSGDYRCMGRLKGVISLTEWSDAFKLEVLDKPRPVLTVSPLWLSPGASVTLNCSVKHPSAGWRFDWYKAVPELSRIFYSKELLPDSINGTEPNTYIVHGQTHTAGYMCRAGRGDPVYYTLDSKSTFVFSGDVHSAASLKVNPDSVQHFDGEPLSLSCEGNFTEWRVSRMSEYNNPLHCSYLGTMTGSTCKIDRYWLSGVYWCESETGQFSNAVNITIQNSDVILVSPARPVTEWQSVTLRCKTKTGNFLSNVDFYKNKQIVPNITGGELIISAVSMSDEGFYKCAHKHSQQRSVMSPESWMSVKPASKPETSPPFPVLLIVGSVCGFVVLLVILLLLFLYRCRKSKDSSSTRSQGPASDPMINQNETQHNKYASVLHGDATFYETIKAPNEPGNDESTDVTYSVVELKNIKKGKNNEPEESTVYSDVKTASATDDNQLYAQVHSKTKAKKDKGKSTPAAAGETVYSEIKPGTTLDQ